LLTLFRVPVATLSETKYRFSGRKSLFSFSPHPRVPVQTRAFPRPVQREMVTAATLPRYTVLHCDTLTYLAGRRSASVSDQSFRGGSSGAVDVPSLCLRVFPPPPRPTGVHPHRTARGHLDHRAAYRHPPARAG